MILFSVIALEKFAQTSENKVIKNVENDRITIVSFNYSIFIGESCIRLLLAQDDMCSKTFLNLWFSISLVNSR